MRPRSLRLAIVLPLAALLAAACAGTTTSTDPAPTAPSTTAPPSAPAVPRDVSFTTGDGLTLSGRLFGDGSTAVVLAHMRPADQSSWFGFAARLAAEGYRALTFDFRGYGESEGPQELGRIELDTIAAIEFLRSQGADRVVSIGASMGGTAAVATAAAAGAAGVATLSAPATFEGIDALAAAQDLEAPALFLAASGDQPYAGDATDFGTASGQPAVLLEGRAHGTNLFDDHGPEVETLLLEFLAGL